MNDVPEWLAWVTAIATGVSAMAAGWAAIAASRAAKRSAELVEIERERWETDREERKRANLVFRVGEEGARGLTMRQLVLWNFGPAHAEHIEVEALDGGRNTSSLAEVFPLPFLAANGTAAVNAWIPAPSDDRTMELIVEWRDGAGKHKQPMTVSFP